MLKIQKEDLLSCKKMELPVELLNWLYSIHGACVYNGVEASKFRGDIQFTSFNKLSDLMGICTISGDIRLCSITYAKVVINDSVSLLDNSVFSTDSKRLLRFKVLGKCLSICETYYPDGHNVYENSSIYSLNQAIDVARRAIGETKDVK